MKILVLICCLALFGTAEARPKNKMTAKACPPCLVGNQTCDRVTYFNDTGTAMPIPGAPGYFSTARADVFLIWDCLGGPYTLANGDTIDVICSTEGGAIAAESGLRFFGPAPCVWNYVTLELNAIHQIVRKMVHLTSR